MSFVSLLKFVFSHRTELLQLLYWVIGAIDRGITWLEIRKKLEEFDRAAEEAQTSGNTESLEDLFRNPKP